ncbi:MAG: hypothetical protein AAB478_04965 [Patescibacteria group bacterium]
MTSLPIPLPKGYKPIVKKGDTVKAGQTVATVDPDTASQVASVDEAVQDNEVVIDLSSAMAASGDAIRKYLSCGPGDSILKGDVIAKKPKALGLKREEIITTVSGTIVRYERDTGRLFIRTEGKEKNEASPFVSPAEITSPLEGIVTVCNNDAIVIESDSTDLVGIQGRGGTARGRVVVIQPPEGERVVSGAQITKDAIGAILLLPDIDKEAVAKAAAIGTSGIIGTDIKEDLFAYLQSRKIDLPVISVAPETGKKIIRSKNDIVIHGQERTIIL